MTTVAALIEVRFATSGAVDAAAQEVPGSVSVARLVTITALQVLDVLETATEHDQPGVQPDGQTEVFHFHTAMAI